MSVAQTAGGTGIEATGGAREIIGAGVVAGVIGGTLPAMMAGVAYGIAIWAVMTFGGLPMLNPMMRERVAMMPAAWFIAHVAFGMGVGSAPGLRPRFVAS